MGKCNGCIHKMFYEASFDFHMETTRTPKRMIPFGVTEYCMKPKKRKRRVRDRVKIYVVSNTQCFHYDVEECFGGVPLEERLEQMKEAWNGDLARLRPPPSVWEWVCRFTKCGKQTFRPCPCSDCMVRPICTDICDELWNLAETKGNIMKAMPYWV